MKKFKTESQKLLDLMINSIYTNKEIFLRELISNASDAVDKLYFKSLTDSSMGVSKDELAITVSYDPEARVVTVSDNGIGMTKDELDLNLGTIAHSDSQSFKSENAESQGDELDIIGQFGVGFYSAFMVASQVRVVSRAFGSEEAWAWESDGKEGYTITEADRLEHGTDVVLVLKPDTDDDNFSEYATEWGLKDLIQRYSNYVRYPIQMRVSNMREKPRPANAGDDYEPEYEKFTELATINSMVPIWKRAKGEVTDEEFNEFYQSNFRDFTDPLRRMTIHAEGTLNYDALLFIPGKQPYNFYTKEWQKGLELYSSNVLIMDKCSDLLPDYFSFVRGVVDSQDLTLNISRETLQQNSQLRAIERRIEKKVKAELADLRDNDRESYEQFFTEFGRVLKFGIYSDYGEHKGVLGDLLLFYSAKLQKMVTLDEYVEAMGEGQEAIYYAAGESQELMAKLPIVTTVLGRGFDVLLCSEDIDDFCLQIMGDYQEKELKNVSSGDLGLETEEEKAEAEATQKDNQALLDAMKDALGDSVVKVTVSTRLTDAPSCVTAEGPISLEMERVMAQRSDTVEVKSQRVLEVNPKHAVFTTLQTAQEAGNAEKVARYTKILYAQALLVEGLPLEDPVAYAQDIAALMI